MSPVNQAGSVSEISNHRSFPSVHMRRSASPVTEIAIFATEISTVTRLEIFTPAQLPE